MLVPVTTSSSCGVTFVLLGSTGSLARLYLWPALYKWHSLPAFQDQQCELMIFAASRQPFTNEERMWKDITSNVKCGDTEIQCSETMSSFRRATRFVQIRSHDHYTDLQQQIHELYSVNGLVEVGRVFYLSIPPSGYEEVCQNIHQHVRPETGTWLRVVLEKPFGDDLISAKILADKVSEYLSSEEIYRVDHYLGKFGVQQILPFRLKNNALLSPLWNKNTIQFVEVAMKERSHVKGRARFYDSYGVIRDVLQNHLMEILVRLLVPAEVFDSEEFLAAKKKVLSNLYPPTLKHTLLGQYMDYHDHLEKDGVIQQSPEDNFSKSFTPTFASVATYLRDPQWHGVPFILFSGKQLDQRAAYARIVFRQRLFHISSNHSSCPSEVIFLIQDDQFHSPGVLISEQLSSIGLSYPGNFNSVSWTSEITTYAKSRGYDHCKYIYIHPSLAVEENAYVSVIKSILGGKQEQFVDTYSLLLSWKVWSPLLDEIELSKHTLQLHTYSPEMLNGLNFELKGTSMLPAETVPSIINMDHNMALNIGIATSAEGNTSEYWSALLGHRAFVTHKYALSALVAEDLFRAAQTAMKLRGEFHMALPGGQSPMLLLNQLSLDYSALIPWQQTHIWQTDERCVKATSPYSNWKRISDYLLSVVPIPFHHVHPMPVDLQNGVCNYTDYGHLLYHKTITESLPSDKLDYIVLGVGADGHVASLFSKAAIATTSTSDGFVLITEVKQSYTPNIKKRMTLGFDAILNARHITIIVSGAEKKQLLDKLAECIRLEEHCDLPVLELSRSTSSSQLSWYIDSEIV